ncbi:MAG: HWE histidine kinase domain-containing protein [Mesorhizobium sp.]|nr:HWE histidine kinase domain-containing protein [Mesorhizobium sp.]
MVGDDARRAVLRRLEVIGSEDDADFDRLTRLAASMLSAPVALVSLVDVDRQWFKSRAGVDDRETPIEMSFCAYTIADPAGGTMVVENMLDDARFVHNPLVVGDRHVRFYAGAPISVYGQRIGTLCVLDYEPRARPSEADLGRLEELAALAASLFVLKDGMRKGAIAEAALVREEMRHVLALNAGSIASWVWDLRTGMFECDQLFTRMFNLPPATRIAASDVFESIDPRDIKQMHARLNEALESGEDYAGEYRVKATRPSRWLASRGRVVERDADGKPVLVFGVNFDVSEHKHSEERQRNLLRELNHRVKNTLATVQALASQTVRHSSEPTEFLPAFSGRLQALGTAHGLLSDLEWRGITLGELIQKQVMPFIEPDDPRIRLSGADVLLSPDQALALGLILHELGSNATKYGALSVPEGGVELSWAVGESSRLTIVWREHDGPPVAPPTRRGFGTILIQRSLGKILSGTVKHDFRPEGVYAELSLELETDPG